MLVVGDHGLIALANLQTEKLFGHAGSELLGRKVEDYPQPAASTIAISLSCSQSAFQGLATQLQRLRGQRN